LPCHIRHPHDIADENMTSGTRSHIFFFFFSHVGPRRRLHLYLLLTWCFGRCLTAIAARFVSQTASIPTTSGIGRCRGCAGKRSAPRRERIFGRSDGFLSRILPTRPVPNGPRSSTNPISLEVFFSQSVAPLPQNVPGWRDQQLTVDSSGLSARYLSVSSGLPDCSL
jgi:hypothetical protein